MKTYGRSETNKQCEFYITIKINLHKDTSLTIDAERHAVKQYEHTSASPFLFVGICTIVLKDKLVSTPAP